MFRYLPEQASEIAPKVDFINNLITDLSLFFTVAICGAMLYFAFRYRRRDGKDHPTPRILGNNLLEAIWTIIPAVVSAFVAFYGIRVFSEMRHIDKDAITINAWGQKWFWTFEYENGKKLSSKEAPFVVPVNKDIKIVLGSHDVLHSFFIPAMRQKRDAVPGQFNFITFKPVKSGEYNVFCAEYCGLEHWNMMAKMKVVSEDEYNRWLNQKDPNAELSPAQKGLKLYTSQGCNACHSLDGTKVVGPSFLKLYESNIKGYTDKFDAETPYSVEEYIRRSILDPGEHVVEGFANAMPSYEGRISDEEIQNIISFIKTLDGSSPLPEAKAPVQASVRDPFASEDSAASDSPAARGKLLVAQNAIPACTSCHTLDGSRLMGPSFKGLFGKKAKLTDGSDYTADEAYIKKAIQDPMSQVVEGYAPAMPPYASQLTDEQISDIIEYLKTVK